MGSNGPTSTTFECSRANQRVQREEPIMFQPVTVTIEYCTE